MIFQLTVLVLTLLSHKINGQEEVSFENVQDNKKYAEFSAEENSSQLSTGEIVKIKNFLQTMSHPDDGSRNIKNPSAYCRSFHTCYECVKSLWHTCKWCHNFGCTDNAEQLCPFASANYSNGALTLCPYIQNSGPILVPAGERMHIKLKLFVPDPVIYDKEVICQIKLKDRLTHLKGLILNDTVYCYPVTLETKENEDTETGNIKLIWGGVQPFSNEIPIMVYRCESLAMECETCRMVPPEYGCGWCDRVRGCVSGNKCGEDLMKWTINRLTCEPHGKKMFYV